MSCPFVYKKRKKKRHLRHKREADRYSAYMKSEKFEEDFHKGIKDFLKKFNDDTIS